MTREEVQSYLGTGEGKALLDEINSPILKNRAEIIEEKRILQADYNGLKEEYNHMRATADREKTEKLNSFRDSTVSRKLEDLKVAPDMREAVTALMDRAGGVSVDDERNLTIGEASLDDWLSDFSNTDTGKKMILAGVNTGGGARGGSSNANTINTSSREGLEQALGQALEANGGKLV